MIFLIGSNPLALFSFQGQVLSFFAFPFLILTFPTTVLLPYIILRVPASSAGLSGIYVVQHTLRLQLRFRLRLSPTVQLLSTPLSGRNLPLARSCLFVSGLSLYYSFTIHLEEYVCVSDWVKLALAVSVLPVPNCQTEVYTSYTQCSSQYICFANPSFLVISRTWSYPRQVNPDCDYHHHVRSPSGLAGRYIRRTRFRRRRPPNDSSHIHRTFLLQRRRTSCPSPIYIPSLARPLFLVPPRIGLYRGCALLDWLLAEILHARGLGSLRDCLDDWMVDDGHGTIGCAIFASPFSPT